MIGLIFATRTEAKPFLEWSQALCIDEGPMAIYQVPSKPRIFAIISGMGKVSAAVACHALIKELKAAEVINGGACGALHNGPAYAPGGLFCITSAVEGDHSLPQGPARPLISTGKFDWDLPAARLITCDRPVFDARQREALSRMGDLVDMEGAAIARVAAMYDVPWSMVKGVTDGAGPMERQTLKRNLTMVSEKVCRLMWRHLREI